MHEGRDRTSRISIPQIFVVMAAVLLIAFVASIMVGRYSIAPSRLLALLSGGGEEDISASILLKVRLSRICGAVLIGGALALSGAAYQGMLRNPMVSPDILGASAGASFGAALAILMGLDGFSIQILAFCFGLAAVIATFTVSKLIEGSTGGGIMVLVLTGMVMAALFSAFVSMTKYVADPYDTLPAITFWLMGGLSYVTTADVLLMLLPFFLGALPMLLLSWRLNLLSMGDEEASALGVNGPRLRALFIMCATLLTSSAVSIGGMIGWVGLIIPHLARMLVGVNHKHLLPASLLIGASFMLIVDDLARSLFAQEIPLGILTAILGAPIFLYLLFSGKRGWNS